MNWALVGAQHQINFRQNKSEFEWKAMWAIDAFFIWFGDMSDMLYVHYYALTPFCDSALPSVDQVRIYFYFGYSLCIFWYSYVHDWFKYSLIFSLIAMSASSY